MAYTGYPTDGWYGNGNGGYAYFRFYIEPTYSQANNQTTVKVKLQVKITGNASYLWNYIVGEGTMTYGGSTHTFSGNSYSIKPTSKDGWFTVQNGGSDALWTKTVNHTADGKASITLSLSSIRLLFSADKMYYITLGGSYSTTVTLDQTRTYTLTISNGAGCLTAVSRSGSSLSNGATIYYGDSLTIVWGVASGYTIATKKVNGTAYNYSTWTVTGDTTVETTATVTPATYTLAIDKDSYSTITVKKGSTTLQNGDSITAGDTLTITFGTTTGYTLTLHTVNSANFNGGNYTVSSNVTVKARSTQNTTDGGVWIFSNGAWAEYQAYIYSNGSWEKYQPYIYTSNGWVKY